MFVQHVTLIRSMTFFELLRFFVFCFNVAQGPIRCCSKVQASFIYWSCKCHHLWNPSADSTNNVPSISLLQAALLNFFSMELLLIPLKTFHHDNHPSVDMNSFPSLWPNSQLFSLILVRSMSDSCSWLLKTIEPKWFWLLHPFQLVIFLGRQVSCWKKSNLNLSSLVINRLMFFLDMLSSVASHCLVVPGRAFSDQV